MLKFAQLFLLLTLFFFVSNSAKAGLLIEPLGGYNFSTHAKIKDMNNSNSYTGMGGAYGGRLGYQNFGFQLGIDYLHSSIDFNDKDFKKNVALDEWAGFVGFQFPLFLRVYAGYIFSASGTTKYDAGAAHGGVQTMNLKSGTGSKFGIGFTGLPFVVLNLEYRRGTIDDYKIGTTDYNSDPLKYSSYLLSLSLPINL